MFVLLWQLVCMAQHDFPPTVLTSVDLGATERSWMRATADMPNHVLQVNCVGKVMAHQRHNVFHPAVGSCNALRRPIEPGTHLLPPALVAAKRAHDHHIVGM